VGKVVRKFTFAIIAIVQHRFFIENLRLAFAADSERVPV